MNLAKVSTILEREPPTNVKQLQTILSPEKFQKSTLDTHFVRESKEKLESDLFGKLF